MKLEISDAEFDLLKAYLHTKCGIQVPPEKRYLFVTRLGDYLAQLRCTNFSEFYHRLNSGRAPELHNQLIEAMTTHETGFFRDGCCNTSDEDRGRHVVCVRVTREFLEFSRSRGNDLVTPVPEYDFPGLRDGDHWCLCARRWLEAHDA